ncbi:unnamed protein product, partial [Rotaria socialis]
NGDEFTEPPIRAALLSLGGSAFLGTTGGGYLGDGGVGGSSLRCPSFRFFPGVASGNDSSNISG